MFSYVIFLTIDRWVYSCTPGGTVSSSVEQFESTRDNGADNNDYYRLSIYRGHAWYDIAHTKAITMIILRSDLHSLTNPIPRSYGRAMGCLSLVIRGQMTEIYREHTVLTCRELFRQTHQLQKPPWIAHWSLVANTHDESGHSSGWVRLQQNIC